VTVVHTPERGRGLALTKAVAAGDLLFVSHPIAVVYGDEAAQPSPSPTSSSDEADEDVGDDEGDAYDAKFDALVARLRAQRYSAGEAKWLEALGAMTARKAGTKSGKQQAAQAAPPPPDALLTLPELCSSSRRTTRDLPLPGQLGDQDALEELVQRHNYEAGSEDADLAYAAGEEPREEVIGLWPEYALLNHSCVPSTVSYAHRGALITRFTRRGAAKGAELFANYIGDLAMAPLDVRREALEDVWGFVCGCPRCREEERLDKDLVDLITDIYESCTDQVAEELYDAVADEDEEALRGLKDQLAAYAEVLDAAFDKKGVSERTQIWLQAGLFKLYEQLYCCLEALGERDTRLSELLEALVGAIMPGSELHCYLARAHLEASQEEAAARAASAGASGRGGAAAGGKGSGRGGSSGAEADSEGDPMLAMMAGGGGGAGFSGRGGAGIVSAADKICYKAHAARYGPISRATYRMLLKTRAELESQGYDDEGDDE